MMKFLVKNIIAFLDTKAHTNLTVQCTQGILYLNRMSERRKLFVEVAINNYSEKWTFLEILKGRRNCWDNLEEKVPNLVDLFSKNVAVSEFSEFSYRLLFEIVNTMQTIHFELGSILECKTLLIKYLWLVTTKNISENDQARIKQINQSFKHQ